MRECSGVSQYAVLYVFRLKCKLASARVPDARPKKAYTLRISKRQQQYFIILFSRFFLVRFSSSHLHMKWHDMQPIGGSTPKNFVCSLFFVSQNQVLNGVQCARGHRIAEQQENIIIIIIGSSAVGTGNHCQRVVLCRSGTANKPYQCYKIQ